MTAYLEQVIAAAVRGRPVAPRGRHGVPARRAGADACAQGVRVLDANSPSECCWSIPRRCRPRSAAHTARRVELAGHAGRLGHRSAVVVETECVARHALVMTGAG